MHKYQEQNSELTLKQGLEEFYSINSKFKDTHTQYHRKIYSKIIYIGDSHTDLYSSIICDVVFATDKLHNYYKKNKFLIEVNNKKIFFNNSESNYNFVPTLSQG